MNSIFTPWNGDSGQEIEIIEIVPESEPLEVPQPVTVPAEPVPA